MRQLLRITATFALALVFTAGMAFAQQNEVNIEQINGDDHKSTVGQTGVGNDADILQDGNPTFRLNGVAYLSEVDQNGDRNTSVITQKGGGNVYARTVQTGDDNTASQSQRIFGQDPGVRDGIATTEQIGDNNKATQNQSHTGSAGGIKSLSRVWQDGDDNIARSFQNGSGGNFESFIDQDGNSNFARVDQSGLTNPGGHFADVVQTGDGHTANVTQSN